MRSQSEIIKAINDPEVFTIGVAEAAVAFGVSRATASHAYRRTGYLTDGVRVLRVGKRCVVSTAEIRRALGLPEPIVGTSTDVPSDVGTSTDVPSEPR